VDSRRSQLEAGALKNVLKVVKKSFSIHSGMIWEDLARRAIVKLNIEDLEWLPAQRWWGASADGKPLEIDIVSESADGSALLVGESKLVLNQKKLAITRHELEQKISRWVFSGKYSRIFKKVFLADTGRLHSSTQAVVSGKDVLGALK